MTTQTKTRTTFLPNITRGRGLLARLLGADARYRQSQNLRHLTNAERRDMGLPEEHDPFASARANVRFLTGQW
ncbi:hypothetical protein [Pseudoruegeria sp. HB172150]|uniref:hypothetical protein n=1 Tax=Pseudoruegeria sp. HB172150 TaxID=2721164 RepID=UPI001555A305|nr:hypothetical protein [Pseudoruegeria sp. HB172150]